MEENWWEILGCCRCCCCWCWQKSTKSTSRHQNSKARKDEQATESHQKMPNVTSGTPTRTEDLRELMRDTRRLLPLLLLLTEEYQKHLLAPKQQGTEGRTGPRIAPKKCLTWLLERLLELKTCGNLWEILDGCCRCCCCCCCRCRCRCRCCCCCYCCWQKSSKSTSRHQNSKGRKNEQATESHQKSA